MLPMPKVDWQHSGVKKVFSAYGAGNIGYAQSVRLTSCWILFLLLTYWQCFMALLLRSTIRTAAGCIWYCCSHGYPTQFVASSCWAIKSPFLKLWIGRLK